MLEKLNELVEELGEEENGEGNRLRLPGSGKVYRHIEVRIFEISDEMHQELDFA